MKAIVIGATGLVGKSVTEKLLVNDSIDSVQIFVRRPTGLLHNKLVETIIDFDKIDSWKSDLQGDVLISALGTTLKAAGSKEAQFKVDYEYQLQVAKAAAENGVKTYVLISSVNSDPKSPFFYLKMKGQLEEKISLLSFQSIHILRPGPLKGHRETSRLSEVISTKFLDLMPKVLVSAGMRPVAGDRVAEVAVNAGLSAEKGIHIHGPKIILKG